eukprot:CAMPEP_0197074000 /NCGR_PEP_ID=MMETSP1384-20130603/210888_1 /TAXON_ID=29189 /ORGANISM="Ammonia sp." /LENGTH=686 /DNA_ID=CAMNT_0042512841 /DNA_START=338 /DNA_END=2399 /DNA_ORIENTATION=-
MQHTDDSIPFISELLHDTNYQTAFYGKWHLGYSSQAFLPFNRGFDETLFFQSGAIGYRSHQDCTPWYWALKGIPIDPDLRNILQNKFIDGFCSYDLWDQHYQIASEDTHVYSEQLYTQNIFKYLDSVTKSDDPFFVYYAMQTPHWPLEEPPKTYAHCEENTHSDEERKVFCNALLYADEMIANIIGKLKANKLYENTVIIFLSDNGPNTNWGNKGFGQTLPLRGAKGSSFEGGIRTPAIVSGGFVEQHCENAGNEYNEMVHITDWFPMIKHLAGLDEEIEQVLHALTKKDKVQEEKQSGEDNEAGEQEEEANEDIDGIICGLLFATMIKHLAGLDEEIEEVLHDSQKKDKVQDEKQSGEDNEAGEQEEDVNNDIDGINLWSAICHNDDNFGALKRHNIMYFVMNDVEDANEGFGPSYIRTTEWKLTVNASMRYDGNRAYSYWVDYDNSFTPHPPKRLYQRMRADQQGVYDSDCYDAYLLQADGTENDNDVEYNVDVQGTDFEYDEIMLFRINEDKIEACNVAKYYPRVVEKLYNQLLSEEHLEEYTLFNIDNKMQSKQGALAQIESYDCSKKKAYHLSWNELEGYTEEEAAKDRSWNDIFYSYVDIVEDCYIKHKHKVFMSGTTSKKSNDTQQVLLFLLAISTSVLLMVFAKYFYSSSFNAARKFTAKDANGSEHTTDITPLLTSI